MATIPLTAKAILCNGPTTIGTTLTLGGVTSSTRAGPVFMCKMLTTTYTANTNVTISLDGTSVNTFSAVSPPTIASNIITFNTIGLYKVTVIIITTFTAGQLANFYIVSNIAGVTTLATQFAGILNTINYSSNPFIGSATFIIPVITISDTVSFQIFQNTGNTQTFPNYSSTNNNSRILIERLV